MGRYFIRRVLDIIPMVFVISVLVFLFLHMIPGDPTRQMTGKETTEQELVRIRQGFGLNDPPPNQYIDYIDGLFHGDLGISYRTGPPVSEILPERLKPVIQLIFSAMIWLMLLRITIGILSTVRRGEIASYVGMFLATSDISVPGFQLELVLAQILPVNLGLLPTGELSNWQSCILPPLTLGCGIVAVLARFSRSPMLGTIRENCVRTARAKGRQEWLVVLRRTFHNSLMQMVAVADLQIGGLLAGSALIETVFFISGMDRLLVDSITFRDHKVIQAELLSLSPEYIAIGLIVDLLYGVLNLKIRYQ